MQESLRNSLKSAQSGVVLLESLIAILVFSFAVLALVGLQAAMVKNAADAKYRAEASFIAQEWIGRMWADPANITSGNYVVTDRNIASSLPGGLLTVSAPINGQFTVTVGWTGPGETPAAGNGTAPCFMAVAHCFRTFASIAGG